MYYVYMLTSVSPGVKKTYVGYTNNVSLRLKKHNSNKGAKSTKGYKWLLIFSKKFITKNDAMSYEYKLKKDKIKRKNILNNFILKHSIDELIKN
ncbi:MAG: GIY-YIG nuclease family protein [Candidatus Pelagibacter bacterium]|nr:GIY-YIG nuclease family protein [Candidatus Pelagibacter sp.]MDC0346633.1 GIY-YIG nuclease family protein [Candidatus Pelagibacter sp.]MDF1858289.1 GIY-YIG nuclease family protein [Candidatus Pelagibacter bacterium]|tara:strand:+ start:47 stop:328 length:282 start_codon:yes stop_codon:yes gene_type:complete